MHYWYLWLIATVVLLLFWFVYQRNKALKRHAKQTHASGFTPATGKRASTHYGHDNSYSPPVFIASDCSSNSSSSSCSSSDSGGGGCD